MDFSEQILSISFIMILTSTSTVAVSLNTIATHSWALRDYPDLKTLFSVHTPLEGSAFTASGSPSLTIYHTYILYWRLIYCCDLSMDAAWRDCVHSETSCGDCLSEETAWWTCVEPASIFLCCDLPVYIQFVEVRFLKTESVYSAFFQECEDCEDWKMSAWR